jgi:protein-S-isoprenylcysteine O-methyltransferase Ste14
VQLLIRLIVIFISTAAWLALAAWGLATAKPFFTDPPLVAFLWINVAVCIAAACAGGNASTGIKEDRGNRWVLVVFTALGLLIGYLPAYTARVGFWTLGGDTIRWCGVLLYVVGCWLRLWPVFVLKDRFSGLVAIQAGHRLVTDGPYRLIRHPSYLGVLVLCAGWALLFRSGVGLIITALIGLTLLGRISAEEALLREHFGAEYEAYRTRTWRLVPGVF